MRYFILGKEASIFWDPTSQLKVVSHDEEQPNEFAGVVNARIEEAMKHTHIIEVFPAKASKKKTKDRVEDFKPDEEETEEENDSADETADAGDDISKMTTKEELIAYYQKNFEVTEEDLTAFKALKVKAMKKFLEEEDE